MTQDPNRPALAGGDAASRVERAARRGLALFARVARALFVFLVDSAFLAYLFVMGSYVVTRIASGTGVYVSIPGGFIVVLAPLAAILWNTLGTTLGRKALQFLSGKSSAPPTVTAAGAGRLRRAEGKWYRSLWGWSLIVGLVVTIAAATVITSVDFSRLVQSFPDAAKILRRIARPDASILGEVVQLTIITVFMGIMSTLLAIPIAVAMSFLGARNLTRGPIGRPVYLVVRALTSIVRSIEPIIWAIIFVIWVRPGPFPGMLALFVCSIADLTKLYSEQLESIDIGPTEAITAVGGRRLQVLLYGIVPQIINPYLSFTLYRCDINVRMGTVIGMVGGGGIGMLLMQYVRVNEWEEVSMCLIAITLVVWAIDTLSARLRARLA